MQRTLRWHQVDTSAQRLEQLEQSLRQYRLPLAETVPLFATLLSLPEDRYPPLLWTPQRQRLKTLESIVTILLEQAEHNPILFILEDLHWTDPTTLEFLDLLIDQTPTAPLLLLVTSRPEFLPTWGKRSYLTQITLSQLSRNQIARMAEQVASDKPLPAEVIEQLVEKTDGVPLFVEEMTKAVLESGRLQETDGHYELVGTISALSIPTTLHDSLMARLDRLVTAKGVAQLGAAIGRQFSYELLRAVAQRDETTLQHELERLVASELLYQHGLPPHATYTFKHALIQDTAYESLLRSTRQQYHQRIAQVLESKFPETVDTQPELLAYHYTEAGLHEPAVRDWLAASQRARAHSAYAEEIGHLTKGLTVLQELPDTPIRVQYELALQTSLSQALMFTKGYAAPEVLHAYRRARDLSQQVRGDTSQLLRILRGLEMCHSLRGEFHAAHEFAEQILRLAQRFQDPLHLITAHYVLGQLCNIQGLWTEAQVHFEQVVALYEPAQHQPQLVALYAFDPGAGAIGYLGRGLWPLGYPDQAVQKSHEAVRLARLEVAALCPGECRLYPPVSP